MTSLADFPELLPDRRLVQIYSRLRKEIPSLTDEVEFATYEQPPQWYDDPKTELRRLQPAQAFFLVLSPNPHPRHQGRVIKTFAMMSMKDWKDSEADAWRYVGAGDEAYKIFKALCRRHLAEIQSWKELN